MKQLLLFVLLAIGCLADLPGNQNSIAFGSGLFLYYSIHDNYIYVNTKLFHFGSVAISFGGKGMKGIDAAHISYQNDKVQITDRNYISSNFGFIPDDITCGGQNDFQDLGSSYNTESGNWEILFRRPLNTKDVNDVVITDNSNLQLAYALFPKQAWGDRHSKIYALNVQLSSSLQKDVQQSTTNKLPSQSNEENNTNNTQNFTYSSKMAFFGTVFAFLSIFF